MSEIETYQPRGSMLQPVTDGWVDTMSDVVRLAKFISWTEFVPEGLRDRQNNDSGGARAAAAILTGRELGLPPMTALSSIHMVKGKPGISAELMRGLVAQRGHEIRFGKVSSQEVTVRGRRAEDRGDDQAWTEVTWTMRDAELAGLVASQPNYQKYPRQMLTARATTELCRLLFADVIHGLRSVEELEAIATEGEVVVEYQPEETEPAKPPRTRREARVQPVDEGASAEQAQEPPAKGRSTTRRRPGLTRRGAQTDSGAVEGPGMETPAGGGNPAAPESPAAAEPQASTSAGSPAADDAPADGQPEQPEEAGNSLAASSGPDVEPVDRTGEESPAEDVVDAEVVGEVTEPEPAPKPEPEPKATAMQVTKIVTVFNKLGVTSKPERLYITSLFAGRELESSNDLTKSEASRVIDAIEQCETNEDLQAVVNHTAEHDEQAGS